MPESTIRPAGVNDLIAINEIYNHYVLNSACTYQETADTLDDRRAWLIKHPIDQFPATVAEIGGEVVGFGSLSPFRERTAYRFSVENSVYVRHDLQRQGIGGGLLADLIQRSREIGHQTIIAGIDADQLGSVALHARYGFTSTGRMTRVGYKFGRWLDVIFMQLLL